ncbi:MAG: hypothetical protein PVF53_18490, partial [Desulfobacterales bacterium]
MGARELLRKNDTVAIEKCLSAEVIKIQMYYRNGLERKVGHVNGYYRNINSYFNYRLFSQGTSTECDLDAL